MLLLICILCVFHFIYLYPPTPRHKLEGEASGKDRCQSMTFVWLKNAHSGFALLLAILKMLYGSTSADELDLPWARILLVFVCFDACRTMPRSRSEAHPITSATVVSLATSTPRTISRVQPNVSNAPPTFCHDTKFKGSQTCWTIMHANWHWAARNIPARFGVSLFVAYSPQPHMFTMSHLRKFS